MDTEEDEMDVEDGAREAFFTQEQAGRGEDAYLEHCARCHGDDLQGNPPLVGDDFLARWDSVAELFDYNRSQMPLDNPGSLDDDTYADITAFILHENDFPAGDEELPADPDRLENYPLDLDATDPDTTGPDTTDTEETEAEEDAEEPEPEEAPEEEPEEEPDEAAEVDEEPEEEVEPEDEAAEPVEDEAEDAAEDPVEDTAPEDEGWYSSEQAARGHRAYDEHCARCHGLALQGVGVAPSLAGMNFIARWEGESVADLFWITSALMPLDDQGALDSETYADLVAYILEQNGFPAGAAEFSPDSERLEGMTIRADQADVRERP